MRPAAAAASLRDRAAGHFLAPRPPVDRDAICVAPRAGTAAPVRDAPRAAVLGSPADAPPVAGALAGALRAAHRSAAAAVAIWTPASGTAPGAPGLAIATATESPERGSLPPATPAALRLAARITGRGLPATGRGRLAWLQRADHPVAAALAARRLSGALEVPVVVALAGPRTEVLEGLLREQDLVVIVAREPQGALARLAVAGCDVPALACAPLAPGPSRLLALAGLAGARTLDPPLRAAVQRLAAPPPADQPAAAVDQAGADW
jgi:hypothetical protein